MSLKSKFLLALTSIAFSYFAYLSYSLEILKSIIPPYLEIENVIYNESELLGLGPGGNEAGIVIYKLAPEVLKNIRASGAGYLNNQPSLKDRRGIGIDKYNWSITPGSFCRTIELVYSHPESKCKIDAFDFASAYDPIFHPDNRAVDLANNAMSRSGNYYTYAISKFIIVDIANGIVIAIYNG